MATPAFLDHLDLRARPPKRFKLISPFSYRTLVFGSPVVITVRKGYITDLASIPQIFHTFVHKLSGMRAAVVHDWLYTTAADHAYTRLQCDRVFLEALKVAGEPWYKRHAMFAAVRAGGWIFFNKARNLSQ